jgi:hypothetical protein
MERVTWDWILAGLDEALGFCRELGLDRHVESSRFQEHRACLAELVGALKSGGQDAARDYFDANRLTSFTALTEGAELVESLPFARTVPRDLILRKLTDVLKGPVLPTDENTNTNQARNILFELTVATKLWHAGLSPELDEHPDVRCSIDGRAIHIECKRPFSRLDARGAYIKALEQIATGLRGAPLGSIGIVALSITRLINPGNLVFKHENEALGKQGLAEAMDRLARAMTITWPHPPPETIGLLWHVITPGFDRSRALLVMVQQMNVQPSSPPESPNELLLKAVFGSLRRMWDNKSQDGERR